MTVSCIPTMTEIRSAIHDAEEQTDRIEQRAVALLCERGCLAGLTSSQQREVEDIVRCELMRSD